jgi:membrane-associated phospholipid phosphatase
MLRMALTFDCTLVGYFATPTAPPWWASEVEGYMDGQVRRVVVEVMRAPKGDPRPGSPEDHQGGANPWAAWSSDHFASTLSAALALREADARAGALGFAYAAVLGFTLVYAGEHYVADLLLGALVALALSRPAAQSTGGRTSAAMTSPAPAAQQSQR